MLGGQRLSRANHIANKRAKRADGWWAYQHMGEFRKNNTVCSCQMCCNPRHCGWNKIKETIQERRANERFKYQLSEIVSE